MDIISRFLSVRGKMLRTIAVIPDFTIYLILATLIFPFYILTKRKLGGSLFRNCSIILMKLCGVRCFAEGLENIDPNETYFVVANHRSTADIPIITAVLPLNLRIMAKKELFRIPLFGQLMWLYDFVPIDRKNKRNAAKSLKNAEKKMKYFSYLVFPEGTRYVGHIGKFKSGALSLTENGCKILPIALIGAEKIIEPDAYTISKGDVRMKIFPPVTIAENETRHELAERLHKIISDYIDAEDPACR